MARMGSGSESPRFHFDVNPMARSEVQSTQTARTFFSHRLLVGLAAVEKLSGDFLERFALAIH